MNSGCYNEILLLFLTLIVSIIHVSAIKIIDSGVSNSNKDNNLPINRGSTIVLKCKGSSSYERCTWIHGSNKCEFEWMRGFPQFLSGKIRKRYCSRYFLRLLF